MWCGYMTLEVAVRGEISWAGIPNKIIHAQRGGEFLVAAIALSNIPTTVTPKKGKNLIYNRS